ncbi:TetR/AcrR family transcriptional regulator [Ruegeria sp. EL01]|jgi:AcrR family transcriptional regulator|uniref:TetR/AcrR family transcriptional regulator n=1 Tax=Ruegeria sp. EL01 TaxID=2107578 RepID=UPI000EA80D27|nr:TetR/AcrR family transcriptional regulator [Ruegeria sp. EL01]
MRQVIYLVKPTLIERVKMAGRGRPRKFDRSEALNLAMNLFWQRGYDGTSLINLEETLSLKAPSIYAAFGSKEKLFCEAVERYLETDGAIIAKAIEEAPTGFEAAQALLYVSARVFCRKDKPWGCMIALEGLHEHSSNEAIRDLLANLRDANIHRLLRKLECDVANKVLSKEQDWQKLATYFVTVQQGMAIRARNGANLEALIDVADCAMLAWPSSAMISSIN